MSVQHKKPSVGLLATTLGLYEQLAPGLRESREEWLRRDVLPALAPVADVRFAGSACRREAVEAIVAGYEASGVDLLLVLCLTYAPAKRHCRPRSD